MSGLTDEMRAEMRVIQANLGHTRRHSSSTRILRHDGEKVVECDTPGVIANHSMFPYKSTAMCVDPSEVPKVAERLRRQGLFVEFDREGRPIIESAKQQSDLAKAMGMKTGRDGYGHTDEHGNFQNSGRRRNDEVQEGRGRVRSAIKQLQSMPESVPTPAVRQVLADHDIVPSEDIAGF